jgi:ABC-type multidrug transport system ATPase subunit/pSer/pThr/pTyr-binding forkhead associated (FHA) protein
MYMDTGNNPSMQSSIKFLSGPLAGKTVQINKPVTTIGRSPNNDIVVRDDPRVSRQHARLVWNDGSWSIEKHPQAVSPVTVNSQSVQQAALSDGMTIGLGEGTSFVFLTQTATQVPQKVSETLQSWPLAAPEQVATAALRSRVGEDRRPDETIIAQPEARGIPSLELSSNAFTDKKTYPLDRPIINVGRDATNDIIINDRIVSGLHLKIVRQGNQFVLIHPNPDSSRQRTLNGLLYQGRKIRGDEQFNKPLAKGDIFRIGDENGTLVTLTYNDGTGTQEELLPPVQPIKLGGTEMTIGRAQDNKVVLTHPQVSAHHARLVREGGTYRILDLNSTNHVYVNSQLTTSSLLKLGDEIRIGPYKLIYEGNQLAQYDESNFIRIDAHNLRKSGNNNVTLLNNISISIPPRKFVALVGGSGAGKSTLMDALNGLRPAQQGKVLYNNEDYYHNLAAFSTQIGYVPQDDIVHRDLTVERALYYAAKLRLPRDFTGEQIEQRIKEVLEDVEMTARRKLLVRKLSGGQRKRVSIALELLANPSLFFLDEPTSGLDPGLDRKMMYLLRKLADKGHTIALVTHATNNINTCDYICFLAQGGRLAYFGPADEAKAYFGKNDFAEIYTSLEPTDENPDIPEEAEAKFKLSKEYQEYVVKPLRASPADTSPGIDGRSKVMKRAKRGNPFKQFLLLAQRNIELLKNDTSTLTILLLQAPLIALLLVLLVRFEVGVGIFDTNKVVQCAPQIFTSSAISATNPTGALGINTNGKNNLVDCNRIVNFLQTDTNGMQYAQTKGSVNTALQDFIATGTGGLNAERALFIISFIAVLFGCINGTREIVKEASIYRRERTVNLGILPYVFSKILVLGVFSLFQSAAILLIVHLFEPFLESIFLPVLLEIYITLVLTGLAGLLVGLAASAFAANEDTANSLLPFLLIPQVVFAGTEIPLKDWPLQIAAALFPSRWAMTALGSTTGLHSDKLGGDTLFGSDTTFHGTLFSTFSHADAMHRVLLAWGALGVLIVVLTIVICIGLKRKDVRV